ncbi:MAG: polysaccharide deacetylase family protein [Bradymonadales bacterium]|nr:polysaccharide deacetylase family protein [Bradymonadales bacterium]
MTWPKGATFAAVSIDMDGIEFYHAIHGLEPPAPDWLAYRLGLARFLEMLQQLDLAATLFVITRDLEDPQVVRLLQEARRAGHEIASHSHHHHYHFAHLDGTAMDHEIRHSAERIAAVFGTAPAGFRAPGYSASNQVLKCVQEAGYQYDSSVFPCPPYYLAKALIMGGMRLVGRRSGASLTDPHALIAPLVPYRPDRDRFHRPAGRMRAHGLWEIPIGVVPGLRFPLIGTSLALVGVSGFRLCFPWLRQSLPVLNLEFHAIDLMDASDLELDRRLVEKRPDLRRPAAQKLAIFAEVLQMVRQRYQLVTLQQLTRRLEQLQPFASEGERDDEVSTR